MAIYRGDGGAGDATNDISINQITELSSDAQTAAIAAASSATSASLSASAASTSATNAANSATSAGTSATNAASSASAASTSASNASTSETNAAASETAAAASETAAALSETAAAASETNAASSASSASTSASTATTQASNAATSATNAANSASAASTSETNAATSESNASTSATNAGISETNAAASYDAFDDRYLGSKTSDPTLDNDGDTLLTGALYYNSSANNMRFYNGVSWDVLQNYTHPDHTGDVTSSGDGITTIAAGAVTNAKLANMATSRIKGRTTAGTGDPEDLTATQVRTLLNVADGANAYSHPNHSGEVTSTGDGAQVVTVSAITNKTALTSGLAATDEFLVNDGGVIKRMDVSVLAELFLRTDNTGNKSVDGNPYLAQETLTDGATITWTPTNGTEAFVTLGGNRTLALNAVPPAGTWLTLMVRQDGTGSRTLAYSATYFNFGDEGTPVLSTGANRYDVLSFRSNGTRCHFIGIKLGFTA